MATTRSVTQSGTGSNDAYGVDGTFAFFDNLAFNTYWAKTRTDRPRRAATPATARSWTTPAIATACSSSGSWSATTSIPRSASCAATTSARASARSASARGRHRSSRCASSRASGPSLTSTMAAGCCRRGRPTASSPSSSRTATGSASASRTTSSSCRSRSPSRRRREFRSAATTSRSRGRRITFGQQRPLSGTLSVEHGAFYDGDRTSADVQSHARQPVAALLARAERLDQLGRSAGRVRSPRRWSARA